MLHVKEWLETKWMRYVVNNWERFIVYPIGSLTYVIIIQDILLNWGYLGNETCYTEKPTNFIDNNAFSSKQGTHEIAIA